MFWTIVIAIVVGGLILDWLRKGAPMPAILGIGCAVVASSIVLVAYYGAMVFVLYLVTDNFEASWKFVLVGVTSVFLAGVAIFYYKDQQASGRKRFGR